ncbi:MAG: NADH-quinone oxidoreductase subunit C [Sphingomonadaceae bacterium]
MIENERAVTPAELVSEVKKLVDAGYRLATATCLDQGENFEIIYHFDKDLTLEHLRMVFPKEDEVPSISGVYIGAFLIENEMKEMFGAKITGIAIDYEGKLLVTEETLQTPLLKSVQVTSVATSPNGGAQ